MKILAVETALGACSVAILDGEKILAHHFEEMARGHAEALAPMVERAMGDAGLAFASLDRLAVTTGPGTFTGQRVGLAFMRGLRVALQKPLIGITSLEAMAAATQSPKAAVIHDAKRDEAYLLLWENGETVFAPAVMPFAQAVEKIRAFGACALAGTGAPAASATLGKVYSLTPLRQPDALWVGRLALHRPAPAHPPAPLYLRAPDAKLPGGKLPLTPLLFDSSKHDPASLAVLHAGAFADAWSSAAIAGLLATPGTYAFHLPEGFILVRGAGGEAEILTLAVAPAARGRGLGRALLRAAANHATQLDAGAMFLEVATDNPAALALYAGQGFVRAGQRKDYGAPGRDALILKAQLPLPPSSDFA
jgi:tRNA threonylcarbamoyladenosine biosynthesis protein TsaB